MKGGPVPTRSRAVLLVFLLLLPLVAGCGNTVFRRAVPAGQVEIAQIRTFPQVRFWADEFNPVFMKRIVEGEQRFRNQHPDYSTNPERNAMLFLSGGGADGAFGAGLLSGWTQRGDRPEFRAVTGVSTGALTAPFAFLGSQYDPLLEEMYTTMTDSNIFFIKGIFSIFGSDSISDTEPLKQELREQITPQILEKIAKEYDKGRFLFIQTTNLDAQRPVVWDMGRIAKVGGPAALELFRQVMLASASIPVVFPPVYIPVHAGGKNYDEMHVDGGTTSQIFVYGPMIQPKLAQEMLPGENPAMRRIYVIVNNRLEVEYAPVPPTLMDISSRSVSSLIRSQAMGALYSLFSFCQRDDYDFNLAFIPALGYPERDDEFDPVAMRIMFDMGRNMARKGEKLWLKQPPGYARR